MTPFSPNCWRSRRTRPPPAQVALAWVLARPWIQSAIIGARNAAQFADSLQADGAGLPPAATQRLDQVSALPHRYPRSMEEGMAARRDEAVGKRLRLPTLGGFYASE